MFSVSKKVDSSSVFQLIKTQLDALPANIYYDAVARRFRYKGLEGDPQKGTFLSRAESIKLQENYLKKVTDDFVKLYPRIKSGEIGVYKEAGVLLKEIHLSNAIIKAGGIDKLTNNDLGAIGALLKKQYYSGIDKETGKQYGLKHFFKEVQQPDLNISESQIKNRLSMYAKSGEVSGGLVEQSKAIQAGHTMMKRQLGKSNNCIDCIAYAGQGWQLIGDLPLPKTQCRCYSNCGCSVIYGKGKLFEDASVILSLDSRGCPPDRVIRDEHGRFAGCAASGSGGNGGANSGISTRRNLERLRGKISTAHISARKQLENELDRELRQKRYIGQRVSYNRPVAQNRGNSENITATPASTAKADRVKKPKLPSDRGIVDKNSLQFDANGNVRIWKGSENGKFDPTFKFGYQKQTYTVEHEGKQLTLNKNSGVVQIKGEIIKGVPDTARVSKLSNQQLFDRLGEKMSLVEDKKHEPYAADWLNKFHGGTVDKSLLAKIKGEPSYGKMELHHVYQFSKQSFDVINKKVSKGEITLDEAKAQMRTLLKPDPKKPQGYSIDPANQSDRGFVVLPAGTHNATSPLYFASHPMGIHPDSGKLVKFGIPKEGSGGRDDYELNVRPNFWKNVYRRDSYLTQNEINKRIKNGSLTSAEAQKLWDASYAKLQKNQESTRKYRESLLDNKS